MAIKFQYNKTSLTNLGKQLKVRQRALPTLKNKESALRLSVIQAKKDRITDIELKEVKVAGVKCPQLGEISYELAPFNAFVKPAWYADGVRILQELTRLGLESEVFEQKRRILDFQRKKTTQKVNLYEKVQIPGFQEAILKIKRYMEDEENLSKAASKIVKTRHALEEEEEEEAR